MIFSVIGFAFDIGNDTDGFEKFFNDYKEILMHIAMSVLGNYHDAEEALMDCFVSIAKKYSSFSSMDDVSQKAYACRTVRNCSLNIWNKRKKRLDKELPIEDADLFPSFEDDPEKLCTSLDEKVIAGLIITLPDTYRDVMYLYYAEDMTAKKIAKTLGLKQKTAETRLARGKSLLMKMLKKEMVKDK